MLFLNQGLEVSTAHPLASSGQNGNTRTRREHSLFLLILPQGEGLGSCVFLAERMFGGPSHCNLSFFSFPSPKMFLGYSGPLLSIWGEIHPLPQVRASLRRAALMYVMARMRPDPGQEATAGEQGLQA
ncbi:unnamed protein product [Rangifer tarandus platyrhynchus]|uniref:Uncharacterized protein n=2 Tax=Rangifer tarandus platyrhynchus TaxID=3082113 RepID=A0AC59Y9W7_RANTA|nr:unnamed protein product [Rangifer tarandus platyrhynchus]